MLAQESGSGCSAALYNLCAHRCALLFSIHSFFVATGLLRIDMNRVIVGQIAVAIVFSSFATVVTFVTKIGTGFNCALAVTDRAAAVLHKPLVHVGILFHPPRLVCYNLSVASVHGVLVQPPGPEAPILPRVIGDVSGNLAIAGTQIGQFRVVNFFVLVRNSRKELESCKGMAGTRKIIFVKSVGRNWSLRQGLEDLTFCANGRQPRTRSLVRIRSPIEVEVRKRRCNSLSTKLEWKKRVPCLLSLLDESDPKWSLIGAR